MRTAKTVRMPRLIRVFAGRICHFVGFLSWGGSDSWTPVLWHDKAGIIKTTWKCVTSNYIWADSWDYGTFRPPSTRSSNTHVQSSSGARCLIFGLTLRLLPYFMFANSNGFGETARMRRLAWAFAGRLCDKYHNLMSWLIWLIVCFVV